MRVLKKNEKLNKKTVSLLEKTQLSTFLNENLSAVGIKNEYLSRYLVELALMDFLNEEGEFEGDVDVKDVINNLVNRTFMGYDPRTKEEKKKETAIKIGKKAGLFVFSRVVLSVICPPAGIALLGYNISNAVFGSSNDVLFPIVVQILLQRLLLSLQKFLLILFINFFLFSGKTKRVIY